MRIVHEFSSRFDKPQAGGSGEFYGIRVTEPPPEQFPGFQVDMLCVMTDGRGNSEETLYFEGDGATVKKALIAMLRTLEIVEKREKGKGLRRTSKNIVKQSHTVLNAISGFFETIGVLRWLPKGRPSRERGSTSNTTADLRVKLPS